MSNKRDSNKEKKEITNGKNEESNLLLRDQLLFENGIAQNYVTTRIASQLLGISENALRIRVNRGQISAYRLGRSLRFKLSEINSLFRQEV